MTAVLSKSRIDKAGRALAFPPDELTYEHLELEEVFDEYRTLHLPPLTLLTSTIQNWLIDSGGTYYIAQRLKRKPQIARKLSRLSVRLSQLQDIGGLRIIVQDDKAVDLLDDFLDHHLRSSQQFELQKTTDYREKGRDRTGYRALHKIIVSNSVHLELQIRSRIQHYWAENIEKTSIVYGQHLKEEQGAPSVLEYFRRLSDVFYEVEKGRTPSSEEKIFLEQSRLIAEDIISREIGDKQLNSFVDENVIKTLSSKQSANPGLLNNWILVFNWNSGTFVSWDTVDRNPDLAVKRYADYEKQYTTEEGYEVVLIGSSDIQTVQETHSHYFGISPPDSVLENLDDSLTGISTRMDLGLDERKILSAMYRKKYWSTKSTSPETLKNHFCHDVRDFDRAIENLVSRELILIRPLGGLTLNIKKKNDIEQYI
jgi:ppGpp synthetase/RelA/SpoT-type nucleotidyltranferase